MNNQIQEQKKLMLKAIDSLDRMDEIFRIYGKRDPAYVRQETAHCGSQYAETMGQLLQNLLESAGISPNDIRIVEPELSEVA